MKLKQRIARHKLIYNALEGVRWHCGRALMRLFHTVGGVREKTVLFSSYAGHGYSDNSRCVSEALHALRPDIDIVWQLVSGAPRDEVPDYVRVVRARSLAAVRAFSTARVFVDNLNRPIYMLKFDDQCYVQTWHGDRGFKKIQLDMRTDLDFPDGRQMDLAVSGSDFGSRVYRSAFGYRGEIMQLGCPRNDILVHPPEGLAGRVRAKLGVPEGARVLLYAPTYRERFAGDAQAAGFSLERVLAQLERATGERWIALTRGHDQSRGIRSDAGTDVSDYPAVNELLIASDMLITDYSSIGGDFMLLGRPVIYYQPDLSDYVDGDRELYFDVDRSPLLAVHSEEALLELLSEPIDGPANCRACLDFFGANETGHASESVAEWISARVKR